MHVGLFVTGLTGVMVRPSKSFGAESGRETGYPASSSRRTFATNPGWNTY